VNDVLLVPDFRGHGPRTSASSPGHPAHRTQFIPCLSPQWTTVYHRSAPACHGLRKVAWDYSSRTCCPSASRPAVSPQGEEFEIRCGQGSDRPSSADATVGELVELTPCKQKFGAGGTSGGDPEWGIVTARDIRFENPHERPRCVM